MKSINISAMINLLFFYYTNNSLEASFSNNRYGDYLYLILFVFLGNLAILIPLSWNNFIVLREPFIMSLIYIYCKKNPTQSFLVFFILKIKAMYFIWFYFAMTALNEKFIYSLSGLIIGHLYIVLKEILPISHRKYYLDTPRFMLINKKSCRSEVLVVNG